MKYRVWVTGNREDGGEEIEANVAYEAAEAFAESYFEAESPHDLDVFVRDVESGAVRHFNVEPDYSVSYIAREKREKESPK